MSQVKRALERYEETIGTILAEINGECKGDRDLTISLLEDLECKLNEQFLEETRGRKGLYD